MHTMLGHSQLKIQRPGREGALQANQSEHELV